MNKIVTAKVLKVFPLTNNVLQILLEPEEFVDYIAGQYLEIHFGEEKLFYSIANASLGSKVYEIHLRHLADNLAHKRLLKEIKTKGIVKVSLPFGQCNIKRLPLNNPLLFIAAGTGFAPIKAMIEQLLASNDLRLFELYWGARSKEDLYFEEQVLRWQSHVSNFQYFSVLSNAGKETLADNVIKRHKNDLKDWQIVISGSFEFAYSTRDLLINNGAMAENLFSDAFDFE